ncbi:MAG: hypothetical protein ACREXS_11400 [Gammaproteobacteria bacterium]
MPEVAIALGVPVLLIRATDAVEDLVMMGGHGHTAAISRGTSAYRRGQPTIASAFQMHEAAALALIAGEEADDTAGPKGCSGLRSPRGPPRCVPVHRRTTRKD